MNKHLIYAGMPRTGSTYLFYVLQKHPGVFVPSLKELNYFLSINFPGTSLEHYAANFKDMSPGQMSIDISPPYFLEPGAAARIHREIPGARLVLCIRDPIEYAISFYYQFRSLDNSICGFSDFIDGKYYYQKFGFNIQFTGGFIVDAIRQFKETFGKNLVMISYEHYRDDFMKLLSIIETFAGIDRYFTRDTLIPYRINASSRMSMPRVNKILFKPGVKRIVKNMLPRKFVHWTGQVYNRVYGVKDASRYFSEDQLALAEEKLAPQAEEIKKMFAQSPVLN